jgi:ribosomal protein S14
VRDEEYETKAADRAKRDTRQEAVIRDWIVGRFSLREMEG